MIQQNNTAIPRGYKMSTLGIIPQKWEVKRFCDITDPNRKISYGIVQTGDPVADGVSCIRVVDLIDGKINKSKLITTSHEISLSYRRTVVKEGDIVFALRGKVGESVYITQNLCGCNLTRGVALISPIPHIYSKFLIQQINSPFMKVEFNKRLNGSALQELAISVLRNIEIPIPPLKEQEKIAEILTLWDSAIETQSALVNALTRRKRALMQQLLTARKRLPNFNEPWRTVTLGKFGSFLKGKGIPKSNITEKGFPCLTYGDIYTKFENIIENISQYIDDITASESQLLFKGDILFAASGETIEDIGKNVAVISNTPIYAGGDIVIFRPEVDIDSITVSYILNSDIVKKQKYKAGQGHSVVHIYTKDIYKIEFQIPTLHEQQAIANVLLTAEEEIKLAIKRLNSFRTQKKALMQQLLTGKKRVKI